MTPLVEKGLANNLHPLAVVWGATRGRTHFHLLSRYRTVTGIELCQMC
jgi:hypothetical protein